MSGGERVRGGWGEGEGEGWVEGKERLRSGERVGVGRW